MNETNTESNSLTIRPELDVITKPDISINDVVDVMTLRLKEKLLEEADKCDKDANESYELAKERNEAMTLPVLAKVRDWLKQNEAFFELMARTLDTKFNLEEMCEDLEYVQFSTAGHTRHEIGNGNGEYIFNDHGVRLYIYSFNDDDGDDPNYDERCIQIIKDFVLTGDEETEFLKAKSDITGYIREWNNLNGRADNLKRRSKDLRNEAGELRTHLTRSFLEKEEIGNQALSLMNGVSDKIFSQIINGMR